MKRHHDKKSSERAKKPTKKPAKKSKTVCDYCSKNLMLKKRTLYVEEEVGRNFCSETCIADFFSPEVKKLEKEYFKRLSPNDLSGEGREELAHLRWITLQNPDEIWREKTLSGDNRFTLISEFEPDGQKVWCICICLFLRGEPSFLYLAFPTKNSAMTNYYRKGERVQYEAMSAGMAQPPSKAGHSSVLLNDSQGGGVREQPESLQNQFSQPGDSNQVYMEDTLEAPDEVWSMPLKTNGPYRMYHFIKYYPDKGLWYLIVAKETEEAEEIEILDAFHSSDSDLVQQFRRGKQEVAVSESSSRHSNRVVH